MQSCLDLISLVPDLRYTLDFLHFHVQGIPLEQSIALLPLAGHMHLRQAKKASGKCDFSEGEIDYPLIAWRLRELHWSGDTAVEFWNSPELDAAGVNPIEQSVVMNYFFRNAAFRP